MILIGKKIIVTFGRAHPKSRNPLYAWEQIMKETNYVNFNEVKLTFPSVDYVYHRYTIFDISGNKYRLIFEIDYSANVIYVKRIWTHAEYSMKKNETAIRGGKI
jgi:mRNA interferase HigB